MTSSSDDIFERDKLLAEIRREFCKGLPDRLITMRRALQALGDGNDPKMVELFYRTAHSLKGTAPSFGAHALVEPATALCEAGRAWYEGRAVESGDLETAAADLDRLTLEVETYTTAITGANGG